MSDLNSKGAKSGVRALLYSLYMRRIFLFDTDLQSLHEMFRDCRFFNIYYDWVRLFKCSTSQILTEKT